MEKPFYIGGGYEQAQLCQNQEILNQVQSINIGVQQNNVTLQNYIDAQNKELQKLKKSKKRKLQNVFIACQNDGKIFLVRSYDNGDNEGLSLTSSIVGKWEIYRLKFKKTEQRKTKFAIIFPANHVYIIGDLNKNSKSGLYDYFIKAQVIFNPEIDNSQIKEALYTTFAPLIENCRNTMEIPELAGWYEKKFICANNFPFIQRNDFPNLPVLEKNFSDAQKSEFHLQDYFSLIQGIRCWQDRILFMILPITGIISSLLLQENIKPKFFVNFVFLENFDYEFFPGLLQIFNRDTVQIIRADANEKNLQTELLKYNDEIVIIDAFTCNQTRYKSQKIQNNFHKVAEKIVENTSAYGVQRPIHAILVVLSDFAVHSQKALNVFVKKNFIKNTSTMKNLLRNQVIEEFFKKFISFTENNFESLLSIIKSHENGSSDSRITVLEIGFEILQEFCKWEGINIINATKLPPKIDFSIFFEDSFDTDDLLECFVRVIRKKIPYFLLYEKGKPKTGNIYACFYDHEYLWISPETLSLMLSKSELKLKKSIILAELKITGNLKTDTEGLTRRLQVKGKRKEFYQFRREFFNQFGMIDIVDLGKEEF